MSEKDLWQWKGSDFGWRRLDSGEGYAGNFAETYLVCLKSEAEFTVSTTEFQGSTTYSDRPREVVCGLADDLAGYSTWPVSTIRPAAHWHPWRPVWLYIIITVLKKLGVVFIIEIKLDEDEGGDFDRALAGDS